MASLDDVVTVQKNGVVGVNALTTALEAFRAIYTRFIGTQTYLGANADTFVVSGSGRLVSLSVTNTVTSLTIHDASSVSGASTSNELFSLNTLTPAMYQINMPYFSGLIIKQAGGRSSITYSGN